MCMCVCVYVCGGLRILSIPSYILHSLVPGHGYTWAHRHRFPRAIAIEKRYTRSKIQSVQTRIIFFFETNVRVRVGSLHGPLRKYQASRTEPMAHYMWSTYLYVHARMHAGCMMYMWTVWWYTRTTPWLANERERVAPLTHSCLRLGRGDKGKVCFARGNVEMWGISADVS